MHPKCVFGKNYICQLILQFNLFLLLFMNFNILFYTILIHSILTHFYFTMEVICEAKSEPSRSLNSEAMSEPSWSMMVETRARAILGNGTFFFFFFWLIIKKRNCFWLITQTQTQTQSVWYLSNNFSISNTFIHIFIYFSIHTYFKKLQK